ncbi:DUF262 domain-containing protein [Flavobacterium sp.]|uniref:DUF262 domain-containing protein n=1 Tax=Flavobacterium sp. TaxID=239 RepID=UPI003751EB06
MNENKLVLKSINDLLGSKFYIPSYQRGYRWKIQQVEDLLKDLWEFKTNPPKQDDGKEKPFYCLQPVVIKPTENDNWEVIDGQQRLTTILIILNYFNQTEFKTPKQVFDIKFETRTDSKEFLENINDEVLASKNIDYFHINNAYKVISNWFDEKEKTNSAAKNEFYPILVNDTKIIWYEVNDGSDTIDIFTRINMGKIPLTNAELIKALFLKNTNFKKVSPDKIRLKQLQIASEWDKIEYTLQENSFWYFISNNSRNFATRIEYIFDLMKDKKKDDEEYFTFYAFNDDFEISKGTNENPDIDAIWLKIKKYFLTFEEWYKDRELYHLIGFLLTVNTDIIYLLEKSENKTKTEFKAFLIEEIKTKVQFQIEELDFYKSKAKARIKTILLLFNIQTIVLNENSNIRFPFDSYKTENWDIEHIRSQTDRKITGNARKDWSKDILEYFTGNKYVENQKVDFDVLEDEEKKLCASLLKIITSEKIVDDDFDKLYSTIIEKFKEDKEPEKINSISNLALLDASTNRSYGNAVFPVKRKIIIENDMQGTFVPICTKNVFLKSYSKKLGEIMYWKNEDANDYLKAIKQTLSIYLPTQKVKDGKQ